MILYWTVLALLLLLPQSINNQELSEKDRLAITEKYCHKPKPSEDGKGTVLCIRIQFCPTEKASQGFAYRPIDTRLLLTAIAFLIVEDDGRINTIYPNFNIDERWRYKVKERLEKSASDTIEDIILEIKAPGNPEEATKVLQSVTDIIFYMGSDHSDSYDEITYAYNSTYLKMKKGAPITNLYDHAVVSFMTIHMQGHYGAGEYVGLHSGQPHSPTISSPGIYRLKRGSRPIQITELNYDPLLAGNRYLM